jgi:Fe-S cluster assembly protein SufD
VIAVNVLMYPHMYLLPLCAQTGKETNTEMGSFLLCGDDQLHDLHSKLRLEHPGGTANQLHKCAPLSASAQPH